MISSLALALLLVPPVKVPAFAIVSPRIAQGLRPLAFAAAPTGPRFVATMEDDSVRVIDANTHMTLKTLSGHPAPAYAAAWSPDGKLIATGDESARVIVWDAKTGSKLITLRDHQKGIEALSFNSTGTLLLSTGKDDAMNVYSTHGWKKLRTILGRGINLYGGIFLPNGNIAVGTLGKGAMIYTPAGVPVYAFGGHGQQGVLEVAANSAGTRLISGGKDATATIWDVNAKKRINGLYGHIDWVLHVAFVPGGKLVATSSADGTVRIWDATTSFKQIYQLDKQTRVVGSPLCFTADGKSLITVSVDDFLQFNTLQPALNGKGATPKPAKRRRAR